MSDPLSVMINSKLHRCNQENIAAVDHCETSYPNMEGLKKNSQCIVFHSFVRSRTVAGLLRMILLNSVAH